MKRSVRYLTLSTALLVGSLAHARELPSFNASAGAPSATTSPASARKASAARGLGVVASVDTQRGVPTFFWASKKMKAAPAVAGIGSAEQAARFYLNQLAPLYNLSPEALQTAVVQHVHDTGRGGIIVNLRQEMNGVEVFRNDVRVLLRQNLELVAVGGNLHADATAGIRNATFTVPAGQAIAHAVNDLYGTSIPGSSIVDLKQVKARYSYFGLAQTVPVKAAGLHFNRPSRAKKVFFPMPKGLVPGYYVEVFAADPAGKTPDVYAYVIAADDGRVLYRSNLTENDTYSYRVWAEATGDKRPLDGPMVDYFPHPTGAPGAPLPVPEFTLPNLVSIEGFNTNPNDMADPWLPTGATETLGNNVDAYTDHTDPDGILPDGFRAVVTSPGVFDYTYDTAAEPLSSKDQSMASVVDLFYVNNWLHDWWYDSGFTEAAGNAQQSNYGRGGVEADVLHAEAQDGALHDSRNNANMSTPADGESPTMQMYVWSGRDISRSLHVSPLNADLDSGIASFGPQHFNITGDLVYIDDGVVAAGPPPGTVTDGCEEPFVNAAAVAGKIALIDRGTCQFKPKVVNAEKAGAIAVIIVNNQGTEPLTLGSGDRRDLKATIPSLSVSLADGATIKAELQKGPVTITMSRVSEVERDGTIDNTVVAHEWGHYLHHRLVNCSSTGQCRGQSEGWADFVALHMAIREGDDLSAVFPDAQYAAGGTTDFYFGTRRYPYTTDLSKNPFTLKHIENGVVLPNIQPMGSGGDTNFEPHNVGEIWASFLFESYVALLQTTKVPGATLTFDQARRLMSDYIAGGMKLASVDPTITEQRDALLAYVAAENMDHFTLFAQAFAKRGAGSCAVAPPRFSTDGVGTVESFDLKPELQLISVKLDDAVKSCDSDGTLDAEETGRITVEITNTGTSPLLNTDVTATSSFNGVTFPNGATVTLPSLAPFQTTTVVIDIAMDDTVSDIGELDLNVTASNAGACTTMRVNESVRRSNYDNLPNTSKIDTVESDIVAWTSDGEGPADIWTRMPSDPTNFVWHGSDVGAVSDARLTSPDLQVDPASDFILSFDHKHEFETSPADGADPAVYWDGAQIQISSDGGQTWADVSSIVNPGYNGTIDSEENPIHQQQAFVDKNPSWPNTDKVTLNFGKALAGKKVRVRFRIASDMYAGAPGWEIDNIELQGIENTPFPSVGVDGSTCQHAPTADAGADMTAQADDVVALDASASSDPDGDALTFAWTQTAGPEVALTDAATPKALFTAPKVAEDTTLTFQVTVSDGKASASDLVDVLVKKKAEEPTGVGGGGTGGDGTGGNGTGGNGTGGNGTGGSRPDTSSSAGGSGSGPSVDDSDGCGCSVVGAPTDGAYLASLLGAAALLFRRRRKNGAR